MRHASQTLLPPTRQRTMQCPTIGCGWGWDEALGPQGRHHHGAAPTSARLWPASRHTPAQWCWQCRRVRHAVPGGGLQPAAKRVAKARREQVCRGGLGSAGRAGGGHDGQAAAARRPETDTQTPRTLRDRGRCNALCPERTPCAVQPHAIHPHANQRRTSDRGLPRCGLFASLAVPERSGRDGWPTQADRVWPAQAERGPVAGLMDGLAARLGEKGRQPNLRVGPIPRPRTTSRVAALLVCRRRASQMGPEIFHSDSQANQRALFQHCAACTALIGRTSEASEAFL